MLTTNARQLELRMIARGAAVTRAMEAAARENLAAMLRLAVLDSSGTAPSPDRSRPYSRRRPHPLLPPFVVNVGSGRFRAAWRTSLGHEGGNLVGTLQNASRQAAFFAGPPTPSMIGRPILQNVIARSRRAGFDRVVIAVRKAER